MKKWKLTILLTIILAGMLLTGCAKENQISVTAEQNNTTVEMQTGDVLVIELDAIPGTGYAWEVEKLDTAILNQDGEIEFVPKKADEALVGGTETQIIRIKAVGPGETAVKLIYHRSFEQDVDPLQTFYLNVVVK